MTAPREAGDTGGPGGPSGAGDLRVGALIAGLVMLGMVVVWGLVVGDVADHRDLRYLLPLPWVLGGTAGLVALVVRDRGRRGLS
ncbi:hypothetical protein [Nocardioides sp.]|uniref:hypothetical protein n=1 Tax=Nocardioides sp. TaxID=35761 RepID=UPI003519D445